MKLTKDMQTPFLDLESSLWTNVEIRSFSAMAFS